MPDTHGIRSHPRWASLLPGHVRDAGDRSEQPRHPPRKDPLEGPSCPAKYTGSFPAEWSGIRGESVRLG